MTLYSARLIGPEVIEAGTDNVVTCPVYRDGALADPSASPAPTLTIWNASNVKTHDAVAVTEIATVATFTITSASMAGQVNSDGWRMEWSIAFGGITSVFRRDAALVYRRLYPVVTDADLFRLHTDLSRRMPSTESSYQDYLDECWATIEGRLIATGKRPWLIMAPSALREVHLYGTLARIFRDFAQGGPGTSEWEMSADYERRYEAAWAQLTYPQAAQLDGTAIDAARRRRSGQPTLWLSGRP